VSSSSIGATDHPPRRRTTRMLRRRCARLRRRGEDPEGPRVLSGSGWSQRPRPPAPDRHQRPAPRRSSQSRERLTVVVRHLFSCQHRGADNRLRRRDGAHCWPPTGASFPRASARWTRIPPQGETHLAEANRSAKSNPARSAGSATVHPEPYTCSMPLHKRVFESPLPLRPRTNGVSRSRRY